MNPQKNQAEACPLCGKTGHHPKRLEDCPNVDRVESVGRGELRIHLKSGRVVSSVEASTRKGRERNNGGIR